MKTWNQENTHNHPRRDIKGSFGEDVIKNRSENVNNGSGIRDERISFCQRADSDSGNYQKGRVVFQERGANKRQTAQICDQKSGPGVERMQYIQKITHLENQNSELLQKLATHTPNPSKNFIRTSQPLSPLNDSGFGLTPIQIIAKLDEICKKLFIDCFSDFVSYPYLYSILVKEITTYILEYVDEKLHHKFDKISEFLGEESGLKNSRFLIFIQFLRNFSPKMHKISSKNEEDRLVEDLKSYTLVQISNIDKSAQEEKDEWKKITFTLEKCFKNAQFRELIHELYEICFFIKTWEEPLTLDLDQINMDQNPVPYNSSKMNIVDPSCSENDLCILTFPCIRVSSSGDAFPHSKPYYLITSYFENFEESGNINNLPQSQQLSQQQQQQYNQRQEQQVERIEDQARGLEGEQKYSSKLTLQNKGQFNFESSQKYSSPFGGSFGYRTKDNQSSNVQRTYNNQYPQQQQQYQKQQNNYSKFHQNMTTDNTSNQQTHTHTTQIETPLEESQTSDYKLHTITDSTDRSLGSRRIDYETGKDNSSCIGNDNPIRIQDLHSEMEAQIQHYKSPNFLQNAQDSDYHLKLNTNSSNCKENLSPFQQNINQNSKRRSEQSTHYGGRQSSLGNQSLSSYQQQQSQYQQQQQQNPSKNFNKKNINHIFDSETTKQSLNPPIYAGSMTENTHNPHKPQHLVHNIRDNRTSYPIDHTGRGSTANSPFRSGDQQQRYPYNKINGREEQYNGDNNSTVNHGVPNSGRNGIQGQDNTYINKNSNQNGMFSPSNPKYSFGQDSLHSNQQHSQQQQQQQMQVQQINRDSSEREIRKQNISQRISQRLQGTPSSSVPHNYSQQHQQQPDNTRQTPCRFKSPSTPYQEARNPQNYSPSLSSQNFRGNTGSCRSITPRRRTSEQLDIEQVKQKMNETYDRLEKFRKRKQLRKLNEMNISNGLIIQFDSLSTLN